MAVIHEDHPVDARGAHVIAAFPNAGLVATMAAHFLVERLGLEPVGVMDDPAFPTVTVIQDGEPLAPLRVYAGDCPAAGGGTQKIVVFLAEFQPGPELVRPIAEALLAWSADHGCEVVVAPEGLLVEGGPLRVFAVGATAAARQVLEDAGVPLFQEGIIAGMTGSLVNLARRDGHDVIALLAEAQKERPDPRGAALVLEHLAHVVGLDLDASDLHLEADELEAHIARLARRPDDAGLPRQSVMYG